MKRRILLIDDDQMLNKINEKVLNSAGIVNELHVVQNGREGINYLLNRIEKNYPLPELIILELNMPTMNGFQFMDEFRKLDFPGKNQIELIVFTASSSPRDRQQALSRGIRHYISKPYLLRGLTDILNRLKSEQIVSGPSLRNLKAI